MQSLAWATPHVDATSGATVDVDWTVVDSDLSAATVVGDVFITMRSTVTGRLLGQTFDVPYLYGSAYFGAEFVSGTPQKSSYRYAFPVPRYADAEDAQWVVTKITASDNHGHSLSLSGNQLDGFQATLTATELLDTTGPVIGVPTLWSSTSPVRPYAYVNGKSADVKYAVVIQDWQSGFWMGWLVLRGPGGQTARGDFAFTANSNGFYGQPGCGFFAGGDVHEEDCGVSVTLPAGTAAGTWVVAEVGAVNNAGVVTTLTSPDVPSITVTSNAVVSASAFTAVPNPVNNWRAAQTVQLTMRVTGAQQNISAIYVDAPAINGGTCPQVSTTPTANADGTVSVPLLMYQGTSGCTVTGLAIVDGAGNLALYGSDYGAPDPGVTVTQTPDTPPVALSATLDVTSLARSQIGQTPVNLTVQLAPTLAPVDGLGVYLYSASGALASQEFGGTFEYPDGTVRMSVNLKGNDLSPLPPGTYTVGFQLVDAANLTASYGNPGGQPVPGGPLTLTITSG